MILYFLCRCGPNKPIDTNIFCISTLCTFLTSCKKWTVFRNIFFEIFEIKRDIWYRNCHWALNIQRMIKKNPSSFCLYRFSLYNSCNIHSIWFTLSIMCIIKLEVDKFPICSRYQQNSECRYVKINWCICDSTKDLYVKSE